MTEALSAESVIDRLGLKPHPEGGHFAEIYRHVPAGGGRGLATSIYYLLRAGEVSRWHRLTDAVEIWNHHAGAPLLLRLSPDGRACQSRRLGADLAAGERPQAVVPVGCWQTAESLGAWTLIGCSVAPAFDFAAFELAPPGWSPEAL